jgi:hypothetical protein
LIAAASSMHRAVRRQQGHGLGIQDDPTMLVGLVSFSHVSLPSRATERSTRRT